MNNYESADTFRGCALKKGANGPSESNVELVRRLLEMMKPKPCPYKLLRIGGDLDGAYLVPDDLRKIKACFSPGVNNIKPFEDELTLAFDINCHMCDASSDLTSFRTPLIKPKQTFLKKWLDLTSSSDSISLKDWVEGQRVGDSDDLLLQMDIEGAEYKILLDIPEDLLSRFRILIIEFHDLDALSDPAILRSVFKPVLEKLNGIFTAVHAHANNHYGDCMLEGTDLRVPKIVEMTYLRNDRYSVLTKSNLFQPLIPHPLDITNVPSREPRYLGYPWTSGALTPQQRIKILKDSIRYWVKLSAPANRHIALAKVKGIIKRSINRIQPH
jgi:FkbM family methyltransferase